VSLLGEIRTHRDTPEAGAHRGKQSKNREEVVTCKPKRKALEEPTLQTT
jgi:hypothetical protein